MSKQHLRFERHHSFLVRLTEKLHWPHAESRAHKNLRILHTAILYATLVLLGYLLAQLLIIAR
ncbi:MAG: hypothetical protein A2632_03055 [Candidatus Pacebacteria bacterium RIFCSPHIGHO2_01_FULL_46_16]|nr:MAG: hypothetical protein A2632_03055 [Candidatus Pacebacteria bacterium RIFCSPHIGHO2_01_FULL_46_16]OGJ21523.1 MAG: hypothetical protein A3J60_03415 [Candidatus Pacebacteria bacterium RIFCSPHIGHO2_02_FULL_46_9]OGJ38965.1 MAG: hypothetical protein A3A82_02370 [Candidatus Pacebacteria bacterium RIFCSPLOWO2_01_FULL_47_12]